MTATEKQYSELDAAIADEFARIQKARHDQDWAAARIRATRKQKDEQRLRGRRDPAYCRAEAERRGLRTVQSVWAGCPCDPALVFDEDPRYLIDDRGVYVLDAGGAAVFVHGPVVEVAPRTYAVRSGAGKWKTVVLDVPPNRTAHKPSTDLAQLADAGLAVGLGDVLLHSGPDGEHRVNIAVLAMERLLGAGVNGEIICSAPAIRSLWDYQPSNGGILR